MVISDDGPPPPGYLLPELIYEIVRIGDGDRIEYQLGAFTSESEAQKCLKLLDAEGRHGILMVNLVAVHTRLEDWSWDR